MVNKIDGVPGHQPQVPTPRNDGRAKADDAASRSSATGNADQVNLTSAAQLLKDLGDSVATASSTDPQRIEAIKQALVEGTYKTDAKSIADKLLNLDQQL